MGENGDTSVQMAKKKSPTDRWEGYVALSTGTASIGFRPPTGKIHPQGRPLNASPTAEIRQNGGINLSTHDEKVRLKIRLAEEEKAKLERPVL